MFTGEDVQKVFLTLRGSVFNMLRVLFVVSGFQNVGHCLREEDLFSSGKEKVHLRLELRPSSHWEIKQFFKFYSCPKA